LGDLSAVEKRKLERLLGMQSSYVLEFSNASYGEFFMDIAHIDIYDAKYARKGTSKANRMRSFWEIEPNHTVATVLGILLENWEYFPTAGFAPPTPEVFAIFERLRGSGPMVDTSALAAPVGADEAFVTVARHVREAIERNEPEVAIDRLHTFLVKYMRRLCTRRGIEVTRDKPLHSLMGEYSKAVRDQGFIESDITLRILRSTISILEALNHVRNERSLAHDNDLLDHDESVLVFSHVSSVVWFLDAVEGRIDREIGHALDRDDRIPF